MGNWKNPFVKKILGIIQHYDENKYWKMRDIVVFEKRGGTSVLVFIQNQKVGCV